MQMFIRILIVCIFLSGCAGLDTIDEIIHNVRERSKAHEIPKG